MATPPEGNIPRIVFKPFTRRWGRPSAAAPPAVRQPAAHPRPGTVVFDNKPHCGLGIRGNGVDPRAFTAAHKVLDRLLGNNPDAQARLRRANTIIVIIPRGRRLTDLDEFSHLSGLRTTDGRRYEDLAGLGGETLRNENFAIAVSEENLIAIPGAPDVYGPGYSVAMHEIAHGVLSRGLSPTQVDKVASLYATHQKATASHWTDTYGASNSTEYFAQPKR